MCINTIRLILLLPQAEKEARLEEYRKKTEALVEAQLKLAEDNRIEMLKREARVQEQLEIKKQLKREEVQQKKDVAAKRIAEALEKHHVLHDERKRLFDERTKEALKRSVTSVSTLVFTRFFIIQ